jgi:hypothetical protein
MERTYTLQVWNEGEEPQNRVIAEEDLPIPERILGLCERLSKEFDWVRISWDGPDAAELTYASYNDPQRGRTGVVGVGVEDARRELGLLKDKNARYRVFTPAELYALPVRHPSDISNDLRDVDTTLERQDITVWNLGDEALTSIRDGCLFCRKTVCSRGVDYGRGWALYTLWFKGQPFMVCTSAGRSEADHYEQWITDAAVHRAWLDWVRSWLEPDDRDVVPADKPIPAMTEFYDHYLGEFRPEGVAGPPQGTGEATHER